MSDKYGDKYRVHNWVKFSYSEIGEYIDENHTDRPLRNDEIVDLLNKQDTKIKELEIKQNEIQEVLTDYFNRYTQMAVELRHDKYGNGVCHDITEVIMEIADKLDIIIIDEW